MSFVKQNCTLEIDGRKFESGGSWICKCADGRYRGVVYVNPANGDSNPGAPYSSPLRSSAGIVTDWHGHKLADASFGARYQSTYCRMRAVSFTFEGRRYAGRYCPDTTQACRVRSL